MKVEEVEVFEWASLISFVISLFAICVVGNYLHKNLKKTENVKIETGSVIQLENGKFEKASDSFKKW